MTIMNVTINKVYSKLSVFVSFIVCVFYVYDDKTSGEKENT